MASFLEPHIIGRLAALPLDTSKPMLGSVSGRHRSVVKGSSLQFAEYRKYVPGDDTRRLDWRLWGRSDRFFIKEFEGDTNLRLCLLVDTSGSMNFGPGGTADPLQQKLHYARRLAGTLAWIASRQGDAVGLLCANGRPLRDIPPKRGGAHLRIVLERLESVRAGGDTVLADALHFAAEKLPRRSLVVIVSDLFVEPQTLAYGFQHLRHRKHDVALFHLVDPSELELNFDQPMKFMDLEGGLPMLADPALIADAYQKIVEAYIEDINKIVQDAEIDYHRVLITRSYADVLTEFLQRRK